jgi:nucleotidyltransferase-like protein
MIEPFAGLVVHQKAYALISDCFDDLALVLTGSGARGDADRWSDVDLSVSVPASRHAEVSERVHQQLAALPQTFALFPADHLNLRHLFICCLELSDTVVKVDLDVTSDKGVPQVPAVVPCWNWEGLMNRACGWVWYTFTKIQRGERFEAAEGLDLIRGRAVVPLWQEVLGLPREGFRHAEQRFSEDLQKRFWDSRPGSGSAAELHRCLNLLFELITQAWAARSSTPQRGLLILDRVMSRERTCAL